MQVQLLIGTGALALLDCGGRAIINRRFTCRSHNILLIFVLTTATCSPLKIKLLFFLRLGSVVIVLHKRHPAGVIPIDLGLIIVT